MAISDGFKLWAERYEGVYNPTLVEGLYEERILADLNSYLSGLTDRIQAEGILRASLEAALLKSMEYSAAVNVSSEAHYIGIFIGRILPVLAALRAIAAPSDELGLGLGPYVAMAIKSSFISDWETKLITRLILYHEVAHVLNGHIDWKLSRSDASAAPRVPTVQLSPIDMQTLEIDADLWAMKLVIIEEFGLLQTRDNLGRPQFSHGVEFEPLQMTKRAVAFGRAVYGYFAITEAVMGGPTFVVGELTDKRHPPTIVRWANAAGLLATIFSGLPGADEILSGFNLGAFERDIDLATHFDRPPHVQLLSATVSRGVYRYQAHLHNHWPKLRGELEAHKRFDGNLAPAETWPMEAPASHIYP